MNKLKMVIPKGRIFNKVSTLLQEIGISVETTDRLYIPTTNDGELEIKIMKPQNIAQLIELGAHDVGFTGYDWIRENNSRVTEILDLALDPVRIVAAVPKTYSEEDLKSRKIIVASEYESLARSFLEKAGYDYIFIRTYGATEAFPPEDADMIIDNTSTGQTLQQNNLKIIAEVLRSSTRFVANKESMKDSWKRQKIEEMDMLFRSVLDAQTRVMLEMNVPPDKLEEVVTILPCMRAPTVSPLYQGSGFAVKVAVKRCETRQLIPRLKKIGATDILEYNFKKVIAWFQPTAAQHQNISQIIARVRPENTSPTYSI